MKERCTDSIVEMLVILEGDQTTEAYSKRLLTKVLYIVTRNCERRDWKQLKIMLAFRDAEWAIVLQCSLNLRSELIRTPKSRVHVEEGSAVPSILYSKLRLVRGPR